MGCSPHIDLRWESVFLAASVYFTFHLIQTLATGFRFYTPRDGQLSIEQAKTRRLAYSIKTTASPCADFDTAAREMAALITGPCWLVPTPDSPGNTDANTRLASMIAMRCPGAQVVKAIYRTQPIQSQCARHKLALGPIPPDQHRLARTRKT